MKANTKSILLVEDNAIIALATKKTLEKYDFAVFVEYSGSDAVDRVKAGEEKWFKANFKGFVENGFLVRFWGSQIEISPQ